LLLISESATALGRGKNDAALLTLVNDVEKAPHPDPNIGAEADVFTPASRNPVDLWVTPGA